MSFMLFGNLAMPRPLLVPFACLRSNLLLAPYVRPGSSRLIAPLQGWVDAGSPLDLAQVLDGLGGRTPALWEILHLLQDQESHFGGLQQDADTASALFRGLRHWMCFEIERLVPAFAAIAGSTDPFTTVIEHIRGFKSSIKAPAASRWAPHTKVGYSPVSHWKATHSLDQLRPGHDACVALLCALEDASQQNLAEFEFQILRAEKGLAARPGHVTRRLAAWGQPKARSAATGLQEAETGSPHLI